MPSPETVEADKELKSPGFLLLRDNPAWREPDLSWKGFIGSAITFIKRALPSNNN